MAKKKKANNDIQATLTIKDVSDNLYLRIAIAEAKTPDGKEIDICNTVDGGLHFSIKDGPSYLLPIGDILQAILKHEEERTGKK